MPTNRRRTKRPTKQQFTPRALALFRKIEKIECTCPPRDWDGEYWKHEECAGCDLWWDLYGELHDELGAPLWDWPCIQHPDAANPWPEGSYMAGQWKPNLVAQELYRALERAAHRRRSGPGLSSARL
jgi:hypothetical protein